MQDARFDKLASLLVDYSTTLKRNDKVLIESFDAPDEMTIALIRAARKAKAIPFVQMQRARVTPGTRARDRWARSSISPRHMNSPG